MRNRRRERSSNFIYLTVFISLYIIHCMVGRILNGKKTINVLYWKIFLKLSLYAFKKFLPEATIGDFSTQT